MAKPELDEQETGNRFADGLLMPIFAVAAVFLFVILCFYAYDHVMKNKKSGDIVVLDEDNSSFKVAPQDPGGMQVEHTDKAVFNTVTGQKENIDDAKVNVQDSEKAISPAQLSDSVDNADKSSTVTIDANNMQEPSQPKILGDAVSADKSEPDASASIKEDSSIDEASAALKDDTVTATVQPSTANSTITAPTSASQEDQAKNKPVQAVVSKETDKSTGESKTIINFHDQPKSLAAKSGSSGTETGKFYVQISSHSSKSDADAAWKSFSQKYSAEIGKHSKNVTEAEVKGKTFYRLSFGPFADRSAASTQCGILKAKGQDCIIQKF